MPVHYWMSLDRFFFLVGFFLNGIDISFEVLMIITDGMFFSGLVVPSSTIRSVILSFSSSVLSTSTTTVVAVGMVGAMASRIMVAVLSEKKKLLVIFPGFFLSSPSSRFFLLVL
jgi:hypothetical protein